MIVEEQVADEVADVTEKTAAEPVLALKGVGLSLERPGREPLRLVEDVDLAVGPGERVALVGESGSGKSVLARSILGLDPEITRTGEVRVGGAVVDSRSSRSLRAVRGRQVAMVFQNPMGSLDPLMTVGAQLAEPLRARGLPRREVAAAAAALLSELGIADAARRLRAYPHEFSGGMQQRVVIAMALAAEPRVLVADEPTTALDVRAQEQVIEVLHGIAEQRQVAVLLISHDLSLVAGFADRVVVMYAGRLVHDDPVDAVFAAPMHPYTRGLLEAMPRIDRRPHRLATIDGTAPSPDASPRGCRFHPRCPVALDVCAEVVPAMLPTASGGWSACHLLDPATGTDGGSR